MISCYQVWGELNVDMEFPGAMLNGKPPGQGKFIPVINGVCSFGETQFNPQKRKSPSGLNVCLPLAAAKASPLPGKAIFHRFIGRVARYFFSVFLAAVGGLAVSAGGGEFPVSAGKSIHLNLDDYLQRVIENNESVQAQVLQAEAASRRAQGELGIFEPLLAGSLEQIGNRRPNTVQEQRELGGLAILDEHNTVFDGGIESLVRTGAKVRLGYTLRNLQNNLPSAEQSALGATSGYTHQYQTFVGVRFTQPLLRNAGVAATMANARLAAIDSRAAFQEYRKKLILTITEAEIAYWNLYFTSEQMRFVDESVAVAEQVLKDTISQVDAGKLSLLDVLEAQSGLALRRTKRNEALEKYNDAVEHVLTLSGISRLDYGGGVRVTDQPACENVDLSLVRSCRKAFEFNPDYLLQILKLKQQQIRVNVTRNLRWPELNLTGSIGYNGLGDSVNEMWDDLGSWGFPSWSVGIEFSIPLGGGIESKNELSAARMEAHKLLLEFKENETRLVNGIRTAIDKVSTNFATVADYKTVLGFNEDRLKANLEMLKVGTVHGQRVLEVEEDVFAARQSVADALVQYRQVLLELQLLEGSTLSRHNIELTQEELRERTETIMKNLQIPLRAIPVSNAAPQLQGVPGGVD